jgi:hypothetical protein
MTGTERVNVHGSDRVRGTRDLKLVTASRISRARESVIIRQPSPVNDK